MNEKHRAHFNKKKEKKKEIFRVQGILTGHLW